LIFIFLFLPNATNIESAHRKWNTIENGSVVWAGYVVASPFFPSVASKFKGEIIHAYIQQLNDKERHGGGAIPAFSLAIVL
jgi:hypothetical protein